MRVGVCSIALDDRPLDQTLRTITSLGARCVEVTARRHRPADPSAAARAATHAADLGLAVSCYGSYLGLRGHEARFRLRDVPEPAAELDIAAALGAPLVRVWAGGEAGATATETTRNRVVMELRRVCELAMERGLGVVVERHARTLADTDPAALLDAVARPDVLGLNYQALAGLDARADAAALAPLARHCHVYDLSPNGAWQPLGTSAQVVGLIAALRRESYAGDLMIEFPYGGGDRVAALARDVAYLRGVLTPSS